MANFHFVEYKLQTKINLNLVVCYIAYLLAATLNCNCSLAISASKEAKSCLNCLSLLVVLVVASLRKETFLTTPAGRPSFPHCSPLSIRSLMSLVLRFSCWSNDAVVSSTKVEDV